MIGISFARSPLFKLNLKDWYLYIVRCNDDSFYTGISTDVEKRIQKHNAGKGARYTKARRPVVLVYSELVGTKSEALKKECATKQLSRKQKEAVIEEYNGTSSSEN